MSLKSLSTNKLIRLYYNESWTKKTTVLEEVSRCSYNVQTDDDAIYKRNRRHLLDIADTQGMKMISESTPGSTPNVVNQHY